MRIVILHGWGHSKEGWQALAQQLSRFGSVHVWDLPGFGDEPLVSDTWGVPEYAAWVEAKCAGLGEKVVLIGHSFGGRICAEIASHKPEWLRAMILIGAPCLYRPSVQVKARATVARVVKPFIPQFLRFKLITQDLRDAEAAGLGPVFKRVVKFDQTNQLQKISAPTLLLWGEHDVEAKLNLALEMHHLISGSELVVLPRLGHNVHLENSVLTYGTIERFLAQH